MSIAYVTEFDVEPGDRSTSVYDEVNQRLGVAGGDIPEGMIVHTAGFADDVFRIFDVWESGEHADRFYNDRLAPIIKAVTDEQGADASPPARQYAYDLHDLARP